MALDPYPKVHLLTAAEAGDALALQALGIEMVVLCAGQSMAWPHSKAIGALAVNIEADGTHPDWLVRGAAKLLVEVYGLKVIGLADRHGGLAQAAFLLACAVAQKQGVRFSAALTDLTGRLPERADRASRHDISATLISQGQSLWP